MARIMAVDYGKKRTGLAVSDVLQITSNGLPTVATAGLMDFFKSYLAKEKVETVVFGLPTQADNSPSEIEPDIEGFIKRFRKAFPEIKVAREDERYTSKIAMNTMIAAGVKKKNRQNKALVDQVSATIILQSYLQRK